MNYETELKSWGSTGSEYPNNYNYEKDEQPVDEWDNFFSYNVIEDIQHLISVTNEDLVQKSGGEISSDLTVGSNSLTGEAGNIEFDGTEITLRGIAEVLEDLNVSNDITVGGSVDGVNISAFRSEFNTLDDNFDSHESDPSAHHSRYSDTEARTAVDGANVDIEGNADTVDGNHASDFASAGHDHDDRYYTESQVDANFAEGGDSVGHPSYATLSDVPDIPAGYSVYIDGDGLYVEDGN